MSQQLNRRHFLKTSLAVGGLPLLLPSSVLGANERLDIGVIGVGGRGAGDLAAVAHENIVALCDVDEQRLQAAGKLHPQATRYVDYRKMLEEHKLDAVVVATPDHHHAPATLQALKKGLHVYCEKPLTHTVEEARLIAKVAAEQKVATQMGTQNHEHPGYIRLVELLQSGAIGDVTEVHVITDRPGKWWKQGMDKPVGAVDIPSHLNWDLWLGPASEREYHPDYVPFKWRGWWDFGCGAIGDMAIHLLDPTFWALELGGPVKVNSEGPAVHPLSGPEWMITHFEFGERGAADRKLPPVKVHWYEGTAQPPQAIQAELPMNGSLFIGTKGRLAIAHGGEPKLLPEAQFADFKGPDPYLPPSPGHHQQWINACKTGTPTGSNFAYATAFTEIVLLGNVAYRSGQTIHYNPTTGQVTNLPAANQYLTKQYRPGWDVRQI